MSAPETVPVVQRTLSNGLRLVVSEDHSVPLVAVNIWIGVGSRHETAGRTGFAHLFEHLMFQGSRNVAKAEHIALVQGVGGTMNGTTWCDRTNYFETVPSNHLALVLWLEADRLGGLLDALDQDNLDNQREVVKNERRQRIDNQPYGTWDERMHALVFPPGHPYHHATIGSMADLEAASLDEAREFYRTYYAPNNAVLSVVGDVTVEEVLPLVEQFFGDIPPRQHIPPPPDGSVPPTLGTERRETVPEEVPVPRVFVGYRAPALGTPDFDATTLLTNVIGGGRGSRLYRSLVLERQLAQPFGASMMDAWGFVGGASVVIGDVAAREGIDADTLEAAYHDVVASVALGGVGSDELERARALLRSEWLHRVGTAEGRADLLSQHLTLFGDAERVNTQLARWAAVTEEDVRRVAADLLVADNRAVLTFLPSDGQPA